MGKSMIHSNPSFVMLCHFVELRRSEDVWTTSDDVLSAEISIMYRRLKAVIFLVFRSQDHNAICHLVADCAIDRSTPTLRF